MQRIANFLCMTIMCVILFLGVVPALGDSVKPGDVIGPHNWEKVKGLVPTGLLPDIKQGSTLEVKATVPITFPKEFMEATRNYAGTVKVDSRGWLKNYLAGLPFPDLNTNETGIGDKLIWNFRWRYQGDDYLTGMSYTPERGWYEARTHNWCWDKENREIDLGQGHVDLKPMGRTQLNPKPLLPGQEGVEDYGMLVGSYPRDKRGEVVVTKRYCDPDKFDDMYKYIITIRRIRRLPTQERGATMAPTIFCMDDWRYFWGKIEHFKYNYLGEKKMLAIATREGCKLDYKFWWPTGEKWELRDVYILEQIPRKDIYPKYPYSKRIFYLDKDSYMPWFIEMYDRKGEYWKVEINPHGYFTNWDGKRDFLGMGTTGKDLQSGHRTSCQVFGTHNNTGLTADHFSLSKMIEISRMGVFRP